MAIALTRMDKNQPAQGRKADNPLWGKKVVIADDCPRQRSALRSIYESLGLVCVGEASNGLECLSVAERTNPDLVSLDVLMPVMHGLESLAYLRESGFDGILVLVTDLGGSEALAEVKTRGFQPDAIFSKQDAREAFAQVLRDVFALDEARRQAVGHGRVAEETA